MSERAAPPRSGAILTIAILAGVCSGVASTVALRLVSGELAKGDALGADLATSSEGAALVALQQEVAALRRDIDQLRLPSPADATGTAAPSALGPAAPATQADVASVAEELKTLEKRLDAGLPTHVPPPTAADAAKREGLRPFLDRQHEVSFDSYLYLTESELLAKYGSPSAILPRPNGHAWLYVVEPGDDASKPPRTVTFEFVDGRVSDFQRQ